MNRREQEFYSRLKTWVLTSAIALAAVIAGTKAASATEVQDDITEDPRYWEIESFEIYEVTPMGQDIQLPSIGTNPNNGSSGGTTGGTISPGRNPINTSPIFDPGGSAYRRIGFGHGGWMAVGDWVYELVRENQATMESKTNRFSVLPLDPSAWESMEGWTGPHVRTYSVQGRNLLGMQVLSFQYQVIFYANGTAEEGGLYVANLQIVPQKVQTAWGYHIFSQAEIGDVLNMGSSADPVAGVHLQIQYNMGSLLRKFQGIHSFFVKGNGDIEFIE